MIHNYFFLNRLAESLEQELPGLQLLTCFSQSKDELVLGFGSAEKEWWIRANLDPNIALLSFPAFFHRAHKNSVDLFEDLINQTVEKVTAYRYDRSFQIHFSEGYGLVFKLYGSRSNVLLTKEDNVNSIFRNVLSQDLELDPKTLNKTIELTESSFQDAEYDPNDLLPALGKEFKVWWQESVAPLTDQQKWIKLQESLKHLEEGPILLNEAVPSVSLLPIETDVSSTEDPIEAANWLYEKKTRIFYFEKEKQRIISKLKQQARQSESYIFKTQEKLRLVEAKRNPEETANIIMANLNLIQQGLEKVTLHDFYNNDFIEIKLNPKLSPQKNAETLYRKSKNRHQEIEQLEQNISAKKETLRKLLEKINEIEAIEDFKLLKKYKAAKEPSSPKKAVRTPYLEFIIDSWQVLVGKNAKANDELTLKIAKKNDLWLHAKDVSGSHVVVTHKAGQNFPNHIIEEAASIAAHYSKRKTETLCPVIYTPKKWVRKVKGSPAGQVVVEREEVVIVEPKDPALL